MSQVRQIMGQDFICPFWISIKETTQVEVKAELCDTSLRERTLYESSEETVEMAVHYNHSFPQEEPTYLIFYEGESEILQKYPWQFG